MTRYGLRWKSPLWSIASLLVVTSVATSVLADAAPQAGPAFVLDQAAQQRAGVQIVETLAVREPRRWKAYGNVLDASPLAALLSEIEALQASAAASAAEAARSKVLFAADENISKRSFDAAQTVARSDAIKLSAARRRIGLEWGASIAALSAAQRASLVDAIASGRSVLLRVSVPELATKEITTLTATITDVGAAAGVISAKVLGRAASSDPLMPGVSLLLRADDTTLQAGTTIAATLTGGWLAGVRVPRTAVLHDHLGSFVYQQTAAEHFLRVPVQVMLDTAEGVVVNGVTTGARVAAGQVAAVHWAATASGEH